MRSGRRGAVLTGPMIVEEARFRRSEFFNDFLAPIDLGQLCVAILDDGTSAEMPRTHLSLYRSPHAEPFDERARAPRWPGSSPTCQRAAALGRRLQQAMPACEPGAARAVALGGLPPRRDAAAPARERGRAGAAGRARRPRFRLRPPLRGDRRRRQAAARGRGARGSGLETPGAEAGGDLMVARPSGRRPLLVTAVRLSAESAETVGSFPARVAVFVVDPDVLPPSVEQRLGCLLGLTAAEQRVARGLLEGLTLAEVAGRNSVSRETVRTQLRAMLAKTGTRRQGELLMVLAVPGAARRQARPAVTAARLSPVRGMRRSCRSCQSVPPDRPVPGQDKREVAMTSGIACALEGFVLNCGLLLAIAARPHSGVPARGGGPARRLGRADLPAYATWC